MNSAYRIELAPLVQHILATLPETQAIYLFGSHAAQTANAQSDLDLALLLPPRLAFLLAHDLWWKLTDELSALAKLNEERAEIMAAVRATGVIYG